MMTEEKAKTKWCPQTRLTANQTEWHSNRPSVSDVGKKGFDLCAGSACMAWRWVNDVNYDGHGKYSDTSKSTGYCGLAGKP